MSDARARDAGQARHNAAVLGATLIVLSLLVLPGGLGRLEQQSCPGFTLPGCTTTVWVTALNPLYLLIDLAVMAAGVALLVGSRLIRKHPPPVPLDSTP